MKCPFCSHTDTQVVETRLSEDGSSVRRRRRCTHCSKRFTTYERAELSFPVIIKKDNRRVAYDRLKLRASFTLALRKRPVSTEQVDQAIAQIEEQLVTSGKREIPTDYMGELVMHELKKLDKVAYVRFASVYRNLEDIEGFGALVDEVKH